MFNGGSHESRERNRSCRKHMVSLAHRQSATYPVWDCAEHGKNSRDARVGREPCCQVAPDHGQGRAEKRRAAAAAVAADAGPVLPRKGCDGPEREVAMVRPHVARAGGRLHSWLWGSLACCCWHAAAAAGGDGGAETARALSRPNGRRQLAGAALQRQRQWQQLSACYATTVAGGSICKACAVGFFWLSPVAALRAGFHAFSSRHRGRWCAMFDSERGDRQEAWQDPQAGRQASR